MKKKSSLVFFILICVATAFLLVASFVQFNYYPGGDAWKYDGFVYSIKLGLDLKGGIYAVYEADTDEVPEDTRMNGTVQQLTSLLGGKGYSEATVVREGTRRIRVEVPDVDDPEEVFDIIGNPAELEFMVSSDGQSDDYSIFGEGLTGNGAGDYITDAYVGQDPESLDPVVVIRFNSEGQQLFGDATAEHVGQYIRIYNVQGDTRTLISNARINEEIRGAATISGNFTLEEAQTLADQIMSGTFQVPLTLIESSVVDPTLGDNALMAGLIGGAIAFLLIMVFMCAFYRMMGMVACITMLAYMGLMFLFLATLPWVQLSLPGIAGIILSIGMMVDGNVIIYERIKDEFRNGKSLLAAYHAGFKKATAAILDSNITTIFAALMLLIFGSGTISGFGLTLLIGLILSIFSSLVLTRGLLKWTINIWGQNPKLYALKRRAGFNEADEVQYVPKQRKPKAAKKAKAVAAVATAGDMDSDLAPSDESEEPTVAPKRAIDEDDFDKIFGDGGDTHEND